MTAREHARRLAAVAAELASIAADLVGEEPKPGPDIQPQTLTTQGDRLLTADQVALALGLEVRAVTRRRFPFAVRLGRRTVRYSEVGLRQWMRTRRL
jgi:predicted DNA-binding transcriptional regulator AlpA